MARHTSLDPYRNEIPILLVEIAANARANHISKATISHRLCKRLNKTPGNLARDWRRWSQAPTLIFGDVKRATIPSVRDLKIIVEFALEKEWLTTGRINPKFKKLIEFLRTVEVLNDPDSNAKEIQVAKIKMLMKRVVDAKKELAAYLSAINES